MPRSEKVEQQAQGASAVRVASRNSVAALSTINILPNFAKRFAEFGAIAYLCGATKPDFGHYKDIRTSYGRTPVARLRPQSWFCGKNKGVRPFYIMR